MSLSVIAATPISDCTNSSTLIECTGAITGQWLNNSDPNRVIWIHNATITASGFLNITSAGSINITGTIANAQGSAGSAGTDAGTFNCGSVGSQSAGDAASGTSGTLIIYSEKSVNIEDPSFNGFGGSGGNGGDISCTVGSGDQNLDMDAGDAGNGANGLINITAGVELNITGTGYLYGYGGAGGIGGDCTASCPSTGCGDGNCIATNGGNAGTGIIELNAPVKKISSSIAITSSGGVGGDGGAANGCAGTDTQIAGSGGNAGASYFFVNTTALNYTGVTLTHSGVSGGSAGANDGSGCSNTGGSAGSASTSIYKMVLSSLFFNQVTETATSPSTGYGILNFTGLVNKMIISNSVMKRYYTYCSSRLVLISTDSTTDFTHTNCTVNSVPVATNVMIDSAQVGVNSQGSFSYTDVDSDSLGGNETEWYVNKTKVTTATNSLILGSGNFSNDANITFSVRLNDTYQFGEWYNSTPALVGDTNAPTVNRNYTSSSSVVRDAPIQIFIDISDGGGVSFVNAEIQDPSAIKLNYSMSIYSGSAINGTWFYNYTPTALGNYGVLFYYSDGANNQNHTDTNLSFTSTAAPTSSSGGGGGGGATTQTIVIDETSKGCNQNKICEASRGEDFINCNTDCKFSVAALTCDDPTQACFFKNATAARVILVILVLAIIYVSTPKYSKEQFKKTIGIG